LKSQPDVSIVIVNFNAGSFLPACIQSILEQTLSNFEVILVDNASTDGSFDPLPQDERICAQRNSRNLGFAKAQNQGIRLAKGKYILPLNFDILLEPTFLEEMVAAIERSDHVGSIAPKLLRMVENGQKTAQFDNAGLLLPANRIPVHRGRGEQDHGQYDQPVRVFGAMGSAALFRKEMLEDIAYLGQCFDESFFTWYEDIDLEWRARLRGWDCMYSPLAVAYHTGDPYGNNRSSFGAQVSMRNRWMMILSNECPGCLARNIGKLLAVELGLLNHVIKKRLVGTYIRAFASLVTHLPGIIRKRRWVRSRANPTCLPKFPLSI